MAISVAVVSRRPDVREAIVDVTCDGAYPANGYALTNAQLGMLGTPDDVQCNVVTSVTGATGLVAQWNKAANKLVLYMTGAVVANPLTEATSGFVSTANVVRMVARGNPIL